jgi:crotonobetainyl-CoA:carnitine CoA-transferase CaiB-like acyl-CoA transferase
VSTPASSPLAGVRVLDLTRLLPGGFLGALLADLGADVVKVEEPILGDYIRWGGTRIGRESAASWVLGRNKRSVAVDLKRPEGVELFLRMAQGAQVVMEGFRPGVMDRLGIGYEAVRERNPKLVYASLTGYGSDGPMREAAGHDISYISYAGVLGMTGPPGGPVCPPGVQVADLGGASILGIGLLAALYASERTGRGSRVEVAMYDAALAWTSIHAGELWASGNAPGPGRMLLNGKYPCYNVYACADGRYVSVGALEPKFWASFCAAVGRSDLVERQLDPTACAEVAAVLADRTRDEWVELLEPADACVAPVLGLGEALAHPLAAARGMVLQAPVDLSGAATAPTLGTPIRFDGRRRPAGTPPPALGADTVALATEAGLTASEIAGLLASGVLRQADAIGDA